MFLEASFRNLCGIVGDVEAWLRVVIKKTSYVEELKETLLATGASSEVGGVIGC